VSKNFSNNISQPSLEKWLTLTGDEEQKWAMRTTNCPPKGSMDVFELHFVKKNTSLKEAKNPFRIGIKSFRLPIVRLFQYPIQLLQLLTSTDASAHILYINPQVPKRSYENGFQIIRGNLL
jgi:hypothetical protein